MQDKCCIWQIVPHLPGTHDGVGDYALTLAESLLRDHGVNTEFIVANGATVPDLKGFRVIPGLAFDRVDPSCEHAILHYANYGYQPRGVPTRLRNFAQRLRRRLRGRLIIMFHELYASGPPWRSAFWLRPFQVKIARQLMDLSNSCFVSNQAIEKEIHAHDPALRVYLRPVMSNFGEPKISNFGSRSTGSWAICGGTALVERSLRSFFKLNGKIPARYSPEQLKIIGGQKNPAVPEVLQKLRDTVPNLKPSYYPEIEAERASELLSECSFGWLDYFGRGKVWPGMVFKSGSFAAFCAHGVIPVFAHQEGSLGPVNDLLPGPFVMSPSAVNFPKVEDLERTQRATYGWYHRHASSDRLAQAYAEALA